MWKNFAKGKGAEFFQVSKLVYPLVLVKKINMQHDALYHKVIVITGASSGLGKGTALELAKKGAYLVLAARRKDLLDKLVVLCHSFPGSEAIAFQADVTNKDNVKKLAAAALSKFGRIDVWINNAGVDARGTFNDVPLDDHFKVVETVLHGVMSGSYYALEQFKKQAFGTLINVASMAGKVPSPYNASYVAANHGIVGLSAALRQELTLEHLDKTVSVCTLLAPSMNTPFLEHAANFTGSELSNVPPVYEPEKVIEQILRLCVSPENEAAVGLQSKAMKLAHKLAPGLAQASTTKKAHAAVETQKRAENTEGSIKTPNPKGSGIKGD